MLRYTLNGISFMVVHRNSLAQAIHSNHVAQKIVWSCAMKFAICSTKLSKSKKSRARMLILILRTNAIQRFSMQNLHIPNENTSIVHTKMAQQKAALLNSFYGCSNKFDIRWQFQFPACCVFSVVVADFCTASWCVIFVIFTVDVYFFWHDNMNFI